MDTNIDLSYSRNTAPDMAFGSSLCLYATKAIMAEKLLGTNIISGD